MFNDRFIIFSPNLATIDIGSITEADLKSKSEALYNVVNMVRRHSVLLKKKTIVEVYSAVTQHADPRIGLILAAARDPEGNQMFPTIENVKEFMYGTIATPQETSYVKYEDKDIFVDGIERVSAALAASVLIAQLAQITEQANHANVLEEQALADLDRILKIPRVDPVVSEKTTNELRTAFYFENTDITINETNKLVVKVYLSTNGLAHGWVIAGEYTDSLSTHNIVTDIADTINSLTLNSSGGSIIAAPILDDQIHSIEIGSRERDLKVQYNVISISCEIETDSGNLEELPFTWSVGTNKLNSERIKSALLKVDKGTNTISFEDIRLKNSLNVLYFRSIAGATITNSKIVYRVSPTMPEEKEIYMPNTVSPELRPAICAEKLLDSLYEIHLEKGNIKALAAIIRNDPMPLKDNSNQLVALELLAYTVTAQEKWLILDILECPPDIELAIGNLLGPLTQFSSRPRSLRVEAFYDKDAKIFDKVTDNNLPRMVKGPASKIQQKINDIKNSYEISYYRQSEHLLIQPPNLPLKNYDY